MKNKYQTVYIELNSGKVGAFFGPVLVKGKSVNIKSVKISKPTTMPDGLTWDALNYGTKRIIR